MQASGAPARRRSWRRVVIALLFAAAILGGSFFGALLANEGDFPQVSSLEDYKPNLITQVYAEDGTLIGEFAIERRVVVGFQDIPPVLRNAIVAVEDAEFWKHMGINPWRIPGAALANLRSGTRGQGFSTLTMQLSRVLFLTPEKTYSRKVKEMVLAFQIEKTFTKEEIFTMYCNQVYFGHGNYGVEAASRFFFGKHISELTLPEAALIAGLPQNPARLSPIEHPEAALERRGHVLDRMVEEKYITHVEAEAARAQPLGLHIRKPPPSIAPYFLEEVRKYLEREYGSQRIYQGGLKVYTTLDAGIQRAASRAIHEGLRALDKRVRGFVPSTESALVDGQLPDDLHLDEWDWPIREGEVVRGVVLASDRSTAEVRIGAYRATVDRSSIAWTGRTNVGQVLPRGAVAPFRMLALSEQEGQKQAKVILEQEPEVQGALLALEPDTGAIKAMVGGYDFERSKFNRATQALRQVGSAFKPILYSAALEKLGWTPATTILDAPISFPDVSQPGGVWQPQNFDLRYLGPIPLRRALEGSRNVPAVRTIQAVGVDTTIQYARKLGITSDLPTVYPLALGAGEVTLEQMTDAFSTFANQGIRMEPYFITRITDSEGNLVEETHPRGHDAIRADTAYLMTSLLRGVVQRGTAIRARSLGRPIAGKTGTTNDWTDGWFIGFEPSLAAGVWVGFDDKRKSLGRGEEGGRSALPIWMSFWKAVMSDKPQEDFPIPGNIVFVPVDASGHLGRPGAPGVRMEAFVAGTEPGAAWSAGE